MRTIVFNTGFGRSGSTLLDMALNSHSKIFSIGELITFNYEMSDKGNSTCGCYVPFKKCEFWERVIERIENEKGIDFKNRKEMFDIKIPVYYKNLHEKILYRLNFLLSTLSIKQFKSEVTYDNLNNIELLYNCIFDETNSNILIDSSKRVKRAVILASELKDKFSFKFIHLVRDGRAVLNSTLKKEYKISLYPLFKSNESYRERIKMKGQNIDNVIRQWKKVNLENLIYLRYSKKSDYLLVRYEDFCSKPDKELKKVCDLLGIHFEKMLKLDRFVNHIIRGNPSAKFKAKTIQSPNMEYLTNLDKNDLDYFNKKAGWLNRHFGYK